MIFHIMIQTAFHQMITTCNQIKDKFKAQEALSSQKSEIKCVVTK